LFILLIFRDILEQHIYISTCRYIILLNHFNNITYCIIFSLLILHLSGERHFRRRISSLDSKLSHFLIMSSTTHRYGLLQLVSRWGYYVWILLLSTRKMSRSQVVCWRRVVCEENINYTITFAFDYPVVVFLKFGEFV